MKNYIALFTLLFILSCKDEKKVPDYVWSKDRFVNVLTEFQLAESVVRLGYHRTVDSLILNDSIYNAMFRKMNTTQAEFDSNYNYYLKDPEVMEKIYERVITNLNQRSAELSKKNKEKAKPNPTATVKE